MKKALHIYCTLLIVGLCLCCNRTNDNIAPYGWSKVSPEFDSIQMAMEKAWFAGGEIENSPAMNHLIDSMARYAEIHNDNLCRSRALYWEARIARRDNHIQVAKQLFSKADSLCDSTTHPYDKVRIEWSSEPEYYTPNPNLCIKLIKQIEILEASGDKVYTGGRLMEIGSILNLIGRTDLGIPYLKRADSLLSISHLDNIRLFNRINIANALSINKDSTGAIEIYKELANDQHIHSNPIAFDLVYGNLYALTKDTLSLRRALNNSRQYDFLKPQTALYESNFADEFIKTNDIDSAIKYQKLSFLHADKISDPDSKRIFEENNARLFAATQNWEEAYKSSNKAHILYDSVWNNENKNQIVGIELGHKLEKEKIHLREIHRKRVLILTFIISGFIILSLLLAWIAYYRHQTKKLKSMEMQLDLEQSQRRVLALQLSVEETNNLQNRISGEINKLLSSHDISDMGANSIEAIFRNSNFVKREQESFMTVFADIRPDFSDKFRNHFPSATEADLRLAIFIVLGLDNKHIARLTSVRPESVKQARWRLKKRLQIPDNVSIREALENL